MKEANSTSRLLRGFVVGAVLLGAAVSAPAQTPPAAPAPAAPAAPAAEAPAAPPAAAPAATDPAAPPAAGAPAPAAGAPAPAAAPAAPAIDPATGLPVAAPAAPAAPAAAPAIDPATGLPVAPPPAAAAPAPAAPPPPPPAPEKPKEPEGKMLDLFGLPIYVQDEYSLWGLFLIAHPIVKFVMMGLALCSIITWAIMFSKLTYFRTLNRRTTKFLDDFRASESRLQDLAKGVDAGDASIPMAQMLSAAANEIDLTMRGGEIASGEKREHLTQRIGAAMQVAQTSNQAELGSGMMFLATVGSIATFVGLFGTVWGIMYSFIGIAKTKTTNLSVVAPGIAEALFATAIGLFAAIPAVVIYNIFARKVGAYNQRLDNFSAELLVRVSRQLDQSAK